MSQGNIQIQGQGNIIIQPATITDQGYYQCFAVNQWGTALTNVSFVQCATLSAFPPNSQTAGYVARQGNSLQLTCSAPASVPNATYSWATAPSTTSQIQTPVPLSARVMVDLSGLLKIIWLPLNWKFKHYLFSFYITIILNFPEYSKQILQSIAQMIKTNVEMPK